MQNRVVFVFFRNLSRHSIVIKQIGGGLSFPLSAFGLLGDDAGGLAQPGTLFEAITESNGTQLSSYTVSIETSQEWCIR